MLKYAKTAVGIKDSDLTFSDDIIDRELLKRDMKSTLQKKEPKDPFANHIPRKKSRARLNKSV